MTSLEHYLRWNIERGVIDHQLRASVDNEGRVNFYIHPDGVDGDTLDFQCDFNSLGPNPNVIPYQHEEPVRDVNWEHDGF